MPFLRSAPTARWAETGHRNRTTTSFGATCNQRGVPSLCTRDLPGPARWEQTMYIKTSLRRTCVAVSGMLVATSLLIGCGQSAADDRAAAVSKDADSLADDAGKYDGFDWRKQAEKEYWDGQQFYDSWDKITPRTATPSCH